MHVGKEGVKAGTVDVVSTVLTGRCDMIVVVGGGCSSLKKKRVIHDQKKMKEEKTNAKTEKVKKKKNIREKKKKYIEIDNDVSTNPTDSVIITLLTLKL